MRSVLIFVPGILTFPGDGRNWSGRAVSWTHNHSGACAEKVEYFCGPIGRAFGQRERSRKLFHTLDQYRDNWNITLVGHSNGAAVILDCFDYPCPQIHSLHLVCGACESSFHANGLNDRLQKDDIGQIAVYVAGKDMMLALAHSWAGRFLGYGILGLHGPKHVSPMIADRVRTITWPAFGHSDCWSDDYLDETLENFLPSAGTRSFSA